MKKFKILFIALAVALFIPSSTFAKTTPEFGGNGTWEKMGGQWVIIPDSTIWHESDGVYTSQGGDFMVEINGVSDTNAYEVRLMEYDANSGDEIVKFNDGTSVAKCSSDCVIIWRGIEGYVDTGEAEFYIEIRDGYQKEEAYATFYD